VGPPISFRPARPRLSEIESRSRTDVTEKAHSSVGRVDLSDGGRFTEAGIHSWASHMETPGEIDVLRLTLVVR
jgi:hypothetical protein